jgi:hypothetical protein
LALTEADKIQLADEKLDPRKLYPCCAIHRYYGPITRDVMAAQRVVRSAYQSPDPVLGCASCMKVYFLYDLAQVAPSQRVERMEEMEKVLRDVVQLIEAGKWDFKVARHPTISVEKDGHPD